VEKLCVNYGPFIGRLGDKAYHDFPPPSALTSPDVEARLRDLGFGYRAKYIYQTAAMVNKEGGQAWLDALRNPDSPAFSAKTAALQDRDGYRNAHEKLLELQGVGPKVADCVCLMGLGWREAVPVDTHGKPSTSDFHLVGALVPLKAGLLTSPPLLYCSLADRPA
jgi:N-glycosylase/DNA lyase